MPSDLQELIARVERLDGPDRQVDADIATYFDLDHGKYGYADEEVEICAFYTRDMDAAIALCERVLPGWTWNIGGCPPDFLTDKDKPFGAELMGPVSWAVIDREVGEEPIFDTASAQHSSPEIAICLATLRALAAEGKEGGE